MGNLFDNLIYYVLFILFICVYCGDTHLLSVIHINKWISATDLWIDLQNNMHVCSHATQPGASLGFILLLIGLLLFLQMGSMSCYSLVGTRIKERKTASDFVFSFISRIFFTLKFSFFIFMKLSNIRIVLKGSACNFLFEILMGYRG